MDNQKGFAPVLILLLVVIAALVAGGGYYFLKLKAPEQKACTLEAKVCPDGSSVGRTGPNCEFSPCPASKTTPTPTITNQDKSNEIPGWKTFESPYFKFSYQYPADWINRKSESGGMAILPVENFKEASWMVITKQLNKKSVTENDLNQQLGGGISTQAILISREQTVLGNLKTTKQVGKVDKTLSDSGKEVYVTEYFIGDPSDVSIFIYNYEGNQVSKYQPQFDQILSTFRFD